MPHRFFVTNLPESGTVTVDVAEAHHIIHVLRGAAGDIVELFDGRGLVVSGEITSVRRRDVELRIIAARREERPAREIILGTAVPKGDRFDWLVEKATELGVTRIVPLVTARSVVDPREGKLDKLRQTVIAACKQSGRNHLLELSPVMPWSDFVRTEMTGREETKSRMAFIAHPASSDSSIIDHGVADSASTNPTSTGSTIADPAVAQSLPVSPQASIVLAVGPEGGFTDAEVALAVNAGATPVHLGPLVLRIETAALALAARFAAF
jgi:16S rRNA (uracil1498-N3)-methyltransferase